MSTLLNQSDVPAYIYWEKQVSALCAQHAINNLLQSPLFDEISLSEIAKQLDENELKIMQQNADLDSADYLTFLAADSANVDESGNFSIEVIRSALFNMNLTVNNIDSEETKQIWENPVQETGFICNLQSHWLSLRKLNNCWFNLNSLNNQPEYISNTYLAMFLTQLKAEGYSIFVVRPDPSIANSNWPKIDHSLVDPNSPSRNKNSTNISERGKLYNAYEIYLQSMQPNNSNKSNSNSNKRNRNPQPSSEEDQLAKAIAMSLGNDQSNQRSSNINNSFGDDDLNRAIQASLSNSNQPSTEIRSPPSQRSANDDDDELARAISLSLQQSQR
jgi:ataxin-3